MELRKAFILRMEGKDTQVVVVRDSRGATWVETESGAKIEDALVLDGGRTVSVRRDGRMHLVDLTPAHVDEQRALVNGRGGVVRLLDELAAAAADVEDHGQLQPELRSEMPGLVVEVKVAPGDRVAVGQAVVVLEAMKMQNELSAPGDAVIQEVLVEPGQSVESGTVLVRFAPPEEEAEA